MNMVMKMMKRKSLEEQYADLSDLCTTTIWTHGYDECLEDACSFNQEVLLEKEEVYLKIQRRKKVMKVLKVILGFLQALIPKDDFQGRYKQ